MKIDANMILREQGEDALRAVMDKAVPFTRAAMNGADGQPDHDHAPKPRFQPIPLDDVTISAEPIWLIDGILPARGLAFIVGPPKSGKAS